MGSKADKGTLAETPQEKALAQISIDRYRQYKQDWLPLQQRASEIVRRMGEKDSYERTRAVGRAATEAGGAFDEASDAVAIGEQNRGVNAGSSAFRMKQAELGDERAQATGVAMAGAENAIDDAYVQGLSAIMATGRNQSGQGIRGLGESADMAGRNAAAAAGVAAQRRAGNIELGSSIAGSAISYGRTQGWGQASGIKYPGGSTGEPMNTGVGPGDAGGTFVGRF
jgi:hypothetical protein